MNTIAIVGLGAIDTLGNSPESCANKYNQSEYNPPEDCVFSVPEEFITLKSGSNSIYAKLDKINRLGLHAVTQAIESVGMKLPANTATVFTTATDGLSNLIDLYEDRKARPKKLFTNAREFLHGYIPKIYGFRGPATGLQAFCASSLYNLHYASHLLDDYEFVVVGAADDPSHYLNVRYFKALGTIGTKCAPFDKDRDGIFLGEGAACAVVCAPETAAKYNLTVHATVPVISLSNDGDTGTFTGPGDGAKTCMEKVAEHADLNSIAFIKAHATGTPEGDISEANYIEEIFGDIPMISYKSKIGHTVGTCGLLEMIYSIMNISKGLIPANYNVDNPITPNAVLETLTTNRDSFVVNALGMGGKNASALVNVYDSNREQWPS